jgi:hypothetical protein
MTTTDTQDFADKPFDPDLDYDAEFIPPGEQFELTDEVFNPPGREVDFVEEAFADISSSDNLQSVDANRITESVSSAIGTVLKATYGEITPAMVKGFLDHLQSINGQNLDIHLRNGRAFKFTYTKNLNFPIRITVTSSSGHRQEDFYLSESGDVYKQTDASKVIVTVRSQIDSLLNSSGPINESEEFNNMRGSGLAVEAIDIFRTKPFNPDSKTHADGDEYNKSLVSIDEDLSGYLVAGFDELNTPILIEKIKPHSDNYLGYDLFDIISDFSSSKQEAA